MSCMTEIRERLLWASEARITTGKQALSLGEETGFCMRFVVLENDTEIRRCQMLVGFGTSQARDEIAHHVQARDTFVVGVNNDPWGQRAGSSREHLVPRLAVFLPMFDRDVVDGARFPLL